MTTSTSTSTRFGGPFRLLWAGQSVSLVGDQVTLIALPLLAVHNLRASTLDVGVLGVCLRFPFLILGLPAGVWVARAGLIRSMLLADLIRGVVAALLGAIVAWGGRSIGLLFAGALILGIGTVFFQVGYQSVVPELIDDQRRWHGANTRLSLSESTSLVAGPALGGLVVAALSPPAALGIDALTYGTSVASLLAIAAWRRSRRVDPVPAPGPRLPLLHQIRQGIGYVRRDPTLNAIMWTGALYNLGAAMYDSMLVIFGVRVLHLSPAALGIAVGCGAIGFPIGSALSSFANARFGLGRSLVWAAVPSVGGLLVAALAGRADAGWWLATGTLVVGLGQGCFAVNAITLRQLASAPEMRAQATSVHRFVSWGALPLGSLAGGVVGMEFGLRAAMIVAGLLAATCFWPLLRSPLATVSPAPAELVRTRS